VAAAAVRGRHDFDQPSGGVRACLRKSLDEGRFAAGRHQPACSRTFAKARQRAGGTGNALSKSLHRIRREKTGGEGRDGRFAHPAVSALRDVQLRNRRRARAGSRCAARAADEAQPPYFDQPDYIAALVASAADYFKKDYDHLLFSFHGIPERHIKKSDTTGCHCLATPNCCETPSPARATCYRAQCFKTAALFIEKAGVPAGKWSVSFQSRLGKDPWLKPYTDYELPRLATEGKKRMLVICPAFVSDCLETIEEIGIRGCEQFIAGNGQEFTRIPCMNEHPVWIDTLEKMAGKFLAQ
jgi:hypothetical protein